MIRRAFWKTHCYANKRVTSHKMSTIINLYAWNATKLTSPRFRCAWEGSFVGTNRPLSHPPPPPIETCIFSLLRSGIVKNDGGKNSIGRRSRSDNACAETRTACARGQTPSRARNMVAAARNTGFERSAFQWRRPTHGPHVTPVYSSGDCSIASARRVLAAANTRRHAFQNTGRFIIFFFFSLKIVFMK